MRLRFPVPRDHRRPGLDRAYEVRWCDECAYGRVWPEPDADEVRASYEIDYYTHTAPGRGWAERPRTFMDRVRVHLSWRADRGEELDVESLTREQDHPRPRLLEIGCGDGGDLVRFARAGWDVVGIDPDPRARRTARAQGVQVLAGTLEAPPSALFLRDYDLLWVSHVLEHVVDLPRALDNLAELCGRSGRVLLEVPNCASLGFTREREAWPWTDVPRHLHFFTPQSLRAAFRLHGLEVLDTTFRGYCRQFSNEWIEAEREVREGLGVRGGLRENLPPKLRSWLRLGRTALARPEHKYDSIRVLARRASRAAVLVPAAAERVPAATAGAVAANGAAMTGA